MMLVPNIYTGNITMIVSPANPSDLCYEGGPLAYADVQAVPYSGYTVRSIMEIRWPQSDDSPTLTVSSEPYNASIDTSKADNIVPATIFDEILTRAPQWGVAPTFEGLASFYSPDCYESFLRVSPEIRYTISSSETQVAAIVTHPSDYLGRSSSGECRLFLQSDRYLQPIFGTNFLRNTAVHFDYTNHRLGFCEPISNIS